MSLRDINILREYRSYKNNVVKEFYLPTLKTAKLYQRAVGFFTSEALIEISKGISGLIQNNGRIELIVSPVLSREDIEAIDEGYNQRKIISDAMLREFHEPDSDAAKERLSWMSYLISSGNLEIKVAFTKSNSQLSMYHEKMGIITDINGDKIAFAGSMNETANAFFNNYESFDVYCSWNQYENDRVNDKEKAFLNIWNNKEKKLEVMEFPEAVKKELLKYSTEHLRTELDTDLENQNVETECKVKFGLNKDIDLYDYQIDAINRWEEQEYRGIFDMATGTGKTFTGLGAASWLLRKKKRLAVIIVCPYQHLVEQWVEDIVRFGFDPIIGYSTSMQKKWKERLKDAVIDFDLQLEDVICFVTTNATFSSDFVKKQVNKLGEDTLIIVDEAHNFGAYKLGKSLNPNIEYRLALSATLERHGDEEGTKLLYNYFGKKCIEYGLERAIKEEKLTPYYYYPIVVHLSEEELQEYMSLSYKISKCCGMSNNLESISEAAKALLIKRARIVAGAINKIDALKDIMKSYKNDNQMLIYCGATKPYSAGNEWDDSEQSDERQIVLISRMLGVELGMKVRHFTSNENSIERENIKEQFAKADPYQALVAIKCLDEGVNIPSIKTAFILASSTNPKEYIQRRGRVLRKYPGKEYAKIYDFITLPRNLDEVDAFENNKSEISLVKKEMERMEEFGRISKNPEDTDRLLKEIRNVYGLNLLNIEEEPDYEL